MEKKINGFHAISRKYFIDILDDINNRNIKIRDQFNIIRKKNNGNHTRTFNEFENDPTVKSIIEKLNVDYPNWYLKKDILE